MKWASEHGLEQDVTQLLQDQHYYGSRSSHPAVFALVWSAEKGCVPLLKLLLADQRVNPSADDQRAIRLASKNGHTEVVKLLLADQRVDPSADAQVAIHLATENGHAEVVKLLLTCKRIDPSADSQSLIRSASKCGHAEVVKVLLADKRVDPSAENHYSIREACRLGHAAVVKVLLADKRVDPSAEKQSSIWSASENGHSEVVKLLLADKRVDPSQLQLSSFWLKDSEVIKLLLSDQRVTASTLPYQPPPAVVALFCLRRSFRLKVFDQTSSLISLPSFQSVLADIDKIESQRKALFDVHLLVSDLSSLCLEYVPDLFCHLDVPLSSLIISSDNNPFPRFSFAHLSTL
jgi:hypothetical protein